jgi:prepilin-type N-terminal cleavage/methylation domain-containing protein
MVKRNGFTLIELLIVISVIIVLLIYALMNLRGQTDRAADARRKSDLYRLHTAMEEYNNDHETYPPVSSIATCGGAQMAPYMATIPCDPKASTAYGYFPSASTGGYRVCAVLADTSDPVIAASGCGGPQGCGVGGGFNYCLSSGTTATAVGTADEVAAPPGSPGGPTATPTPAGPGTPTPTINPLYNNACAPVDFTGISYCKSYSNPGPGGGDCPITYPSGTNCNNQCGNPAVRCSQ